MTTVKRTVSAKARIESPYLPDLKESLDRPPDIVLAEKEDIPKQKQGLELANESKEKREKKATKIKRRLTSFMASTPFNKNDKVNKHYKERSEEFESICEELINLTFEKELYNCKACTQEREISFNGRTLRTLDISILNLPRDTHPNLIWNYLKKEDEYNCQKIIFECKNYSQLTKIGVGEVYQLYGYLDPKNIGKFGVILNKFGFSNLSVKGKEAIKRVKKDDYLILVLGREEMGEWLNEWIENESCQRFFNEQISRFMSLSK